jgi:sec-independent protein translocase protein TatC
MNLETVDPEHYKMGLLEHLRELRKRLLYSLVAILIGAIAAYYYSGQVFEILCAPFFQGFGSSALIGTSPAEAWILKVKVAIFCGTLVMSPVLFYQLWAFVAPGLYESERKLAIPFVVVSSSLFIGGAIFCYYTVLPLTFSFFYEEFLSIKVLPTIRIGDHLSLTIMTLVGFGMVFELPLATFILSRAGIIDHTFLIQWYRQAVVIIFVVAAVLTPPDVLTQLLMAGPLLLLYGLSILIARVASRKTADDTPKSISPHAAARPQ